MSHKNNNQPSEYTVDDILAEFGSKPSDDAEPAVEAEESVVEEQDTAPNETALLKEEISGLREELAVLKEELALLKEGAAANAQADEPDADESSIENITLDPETTEDSPDENYDPDGEAAMPKVVPIISAAPTASFNDTDVTIEDPFGKNTPKAEPSELQEEINDIITGIWEPTVEVSSEDTDSDEAAFSEELEEDLVTEELSASSVYTEDNDVITLDEEDKTENFGTEENNIPSEAEKSEKASEKAEALTENPKEGGEISESMSPSDENEKKPFWQNIIPWKGDDAFEIIRKIIFIVAIIVFIAAGIMLATTLGDSKKAVADANENKDIIVTTTATSINEEGEVVVVAPTEDEIIEHNIDVMQFYKETSKNVVGYIDLAGCDLFQPIVQGDDNEYYLTHTYYDEKNKGGAIFADYRCRIEEDYISPNLVLYGHNQEDGTMFGNLKNYKQDLDFYAANPVVTIGTDYGVNKYLIYGFFVTNALENQDTYGEVFHYHDYIEVMNDEATFNWYIKEVNERNQIISPVDVRFGDQLLCLSTCSNEFSNSRFVVFARQLREDESLEDFDFTNAYFNPNARGVDWSAIMSGETSEESTEEAFEETSEEETESATEEVTTVPESEDTEEEETSAKKTKKTESTSKTKRVDRTKTVYSHTLNTTTEETESESALTDENGDPITYPPVTDESGNPVTDENGATVTGVPESANEGTGTETAGITE